MLKKCIIASSMILLGAVGGFGGYKVDYTHKEKPLFSCNSPLRAEKGSSASTRAEWTDDVRFSLKIDFDKDKYLYYEVITINSLFSYADVYDVKDSDGEIPVWDIPDIYDFIVVFAHADHDCTTMIVKEGVKVESGTVVEISDKEATSLIDFSLVAPNGKPMVGNISYEDDSYEEGEVVDGYAHTFLCNIDEDNIVLEMTDVLDMVEKNGKIQYGGRQADILINPLPEDTKYSLSHIRAATLRHGSAVAKLQASGFGTQKLINTADSYILTRHRFMEHKSGNSFAQYEDIKSGNSMRYVPIWKDLIQEMNVRKNAYTIELPENDKLYISAPPSQDPGNPFEVICSLGTCDNTDATGTQFDSHYYGMTSAFLRQTSPSALEFIDFPAQNGGRYDYWTRDIDNPKANMGSINEYLTRPAEPEAVYTWGDSAPICLASVGYLDWDDSELRFSYIGRKGENRGIDKNATDFSMTGDGMVISSSLKWPDTDFSNWRLRNGEFNPTNAEYLITLYNRNIIVDGLDGYNKTTIGYDSNLSSPNPPSLRTLQVIDAEGNVNDRLSDAEGAAIEFYAGDFEFTPGVSYGDKYFVYNDLDEVKVEYAPYGTSEWSPLKAEVIEEEFHPVSYGALYRVDLSGVDMKSETGWYALRIRLTDESGNYHEQELSPVFSLSDPSGMGTAPSLAGISSLEEVNVYSAAGIKVFEGSYGTLDRSSLPAGVYVVKGNGSVTQKITVR